jgi:hypothetical protein
MEANQMHTGELAIALANTLELRRDGTTVDLLADQEGLARWLRRAGGALAVLAAPAARASLAPRTRPAVAMGSAPSGCRRCAGMSWRCWAPRSGSGPCRGPR